MGKSQPFLDICQCQAAVANGLCSSCRLLFSGGKSGDRDGEMEVVGWRVGRQKLLVYHKLRRSRDLRDSASGPDACRSPTMYTRRSLYQQKAVCAGGSAGGARMSTGKLSKNIQWVANSSGNLWHPAPRPEQVIPQTKFLVSRRSPFTSVFLRNLLMSKSSESQLVTWEEFFPS